MVFSVRAKDGKVRLATTACPARALDELPEAKDLVLWWMNSSTWGEQSGQPLGPPEWPRAGGLLRQPAVLVEAVSILRSEWTHVQRASK